LSILLNPCHDLSLSLKFSTILPNFTMTPTGQTKRDSSII